MRAEGPSRAAPGHAAGQGRGQVSSDSAAGRRHTPGTKRALASGRSQGRDTGKARRTEKRRGGSQGSRRSQGQHPAERSPGERGGAGGGAQVGEEGRRWRTFWRAFWRAFWIWAAGPQAAEARGLARSSSFRKRGQVAA